MATVQTASDDVSIVIARDPALVRTVRLVAAAVARRSDRSDSVIEEIRLAVGEACALMIGADADAAADAVSTEERVSVVIGTGPQLTVTVTGRVVDEASEIQELGLDPYALIRGLSESFSATRKGDATTVEMSWAL